MVFRTLALLSALAALACGDVSARRMVAQQDSAADAKLPIIFFHGVTGNADNAANFVANLTAEGRVIVPLTFCQNECSLQSMKTQLPMAIAQVREIVTNNATFDDGYIFIGHSQGGQISRSVIELMDDHKVRKYISLAGLQNGIFFGPNDPETAYAMSGMNDYLVAGTDFNYSSYPLEDYYGKVQHDLHQYWLLNPQWYYKLAQPDEARSPVFESWAASNPHLPVVNNVNLCATNDTQCEDAKAQRKANFLRVEEAHFFGSSEDHVITPWESELFGQVSEVDSLDAIITDFANMTILNMTETREYINDTFGLKTLNERGGLHLHEVDGVTHGCWIADDTRADGTACVFDTIYDQYIYPLLQ